MSGIDNYVKTINFLHDMHVIRWLPWNHQSLWTLIGHIKNSLRWMNEQVQKVSAS